jgi:hypothetical protein
VLLRQVSCNWHGVDRNTFQGWLPERLKSVNSSHDCSTLASSFNSGFPAQIPKSSLQSEFVEELLNSGLPRALPVVIEAAGIPFLGQLPAHLHGHDVAFRQIAPRQPPVEMILRPEGEDRRSRVADVFPEPDGRDHEVNNPIRIHRLT